MNSKISEELLEKIQKLLDKANSAKEIGSLAEAEVFISKVHDLLTKYNLSLESLEQSNSSKNNEFEIQESDKIIIGLNKEEGIWEDSLIKVITLNNYCDRLRYPNYLKDERGNYLRTPQGDRRQAGYSYSIIGQPQNVMMCKYMYDILKELFPKLGGESYNKKFLELRTQYSLLTSKQFALANFENKFAELKGVIKLEDLMPSDYSESAQNSPQIWKLKNLKKIDFPDRGAYIRSFLIGCPRGLDEKLKALRKEETLIDNKSLENQNTALAVQTMIVKNEKSIKKFFDKAGVTYSKATVKQASSVDALKDGISAGKNVTLHKGVTSNNTFSPKYLN